MTCEHDKRPQWRFAGEPPANRSRSEGIGPWASRPTQPVPGRSTLVESLDPAPVAPPRSGHGNTKQKPTAPKADDTQKAGEAPLGTWAGAGVLGRIFQNDTAETFVDAATGDTVAVRNGYAVVNGKVQRADYIRPCSPGSCDFPRPIKVPPDHFFMMGDNRGASDDSRFWGPVPEKWLIGQAFLTYWPVDRIGIL